MKIKNILNFKKYPLYFAVLRKKFSPKIGKVSYAQCGEDLIVRFIFDALHMEKPTYFDIGAHHPKFLSNTYLFYKKGSSGVCIEPDPILFERIKNDRPRDLCLNIGVGSKEQDLAEFYIMTAGVLNTFSKEEAENIAKTTTKKIKRVVKIPLIPIDQMIKTYNVGTPDFVSLDTEGYDFEILKSLNFQTFRPAVFCVETLTYTENKSEVKEKDIVQFMEKQGYFVYADTFINTIFVDKDKWNSR